MTATNECRNIFGDVPVLYNWCSGWDSSEIFKAKAQPVNVVSYTFPIWTTLKIAVELGFSDGDKARSV